MPIENHPKRIKLGITDGLRAHTSQVLFDNGTHKCISFTSLVKGEGVQANQFLILDNERAALMMDGYTRNHGIARIHYYLHAALAGLYRSQSRSFQALGAFLAASEFSLYE